MPFNPPALDDRSFTDLVNELVTRIPAHTPEWTNPVIGDPGRTLIDLFAWLGDALLYRVNLIPERQRLAFLSLLGQQMQPATPATGMISLAFTDQTATTAVSLASAATVTGPVNFETLSEITVLPITGQCYYKQKLDQATLNKLQPVIAGLTYVYKINPPVAPYVTTPLFDSNQPDTAGFEVSQNTAVDQCVWIALLAGAKADPAAVRKSFGSGSQQVFLNVGFQAATDIPGITAEIGSNRPPVRHTWQMTTANVASPLLTLQEVAGSDTTAGLTQTGTVRVALPQATDIGAPENDIHKSPNAGVGPAPPRIDDPSVASRLVTWLCLRLSDTLNVSWLGANAVQIDARQTITGRVIGVGDGTGDQVFSLGVTPVDPTTFQLQVETANIGYQRWTAIDDLGAANFNDQVFELDAEAGAVTFGNGVRGQVVGAGSRVRVASMRAGGGSSGNLPPQSLKGLLAFDLTGKSVSGLQVIQPMPLQGGVDSESLAGAEQRIPAILRNRDRAVTTQDYRDLASTVPGAAVGRVEVLPLFHPQNFESNVPGVVSVMILPERDTVGLPNPRAGRALLETVFAYLEPRKPLATELYVIGCDYVGIGLSIGIAVRNGYGPDTVAAQVKAAVRNALWPLPPGGYTRTGYPLGRAVRTLELEVVIANVPGVDEVSGLKLFQQQTSGVFTLVTSGGDHPSLALESYQLPELLRCVVGMGDAADSLDPVEDSQDGTPIPVIPEVC